jgi:hypothetical protein
MSDEPLRYADKTRCGVNFFQDRSFGHAQGPLRPNPDMAQKDRPLVEREAEEAAWSNAVQMATEVAARRCPGSCRRRSSASDPHDPEPLVQRATTYWSGLSTEILKNDEVDGTHVRVKAYRFIVYAYSDWEVRFACD